jgi:hypothetical protein
MLRVLGAMPFMHLGHHVLAAVAGSHSLMFGMLAHLHLLPLLCMLGVRIGGGRSGWRLGGQSGRSNQSHHDNSPENRLFA